MSLGRGLSTFGQQQQQKLLPRCHRLLPAAPLEPQEARSWLIGELNEVINVTRVRSALGTRTNATMCEVQYYTLL